MNNTLFFSLYSLAHQSALFDNIVVFTAVWLGVVVIIFTVLFLLLHRDSGMERHSVASLTQKGKEIGIVFLAALCAWIVAGLLKKFIGSPRPFDAFSSVHPLFSETGFGFPSGHATFFSALAAATYLYHRKLGTALGAAALLVGTARIIGGVHFPFDILGGFILGPISAIIAYRILRWFGKKYDVI
jgi:undecaprenyl-diphosphatase